MKAKKSPAELELALLRWAEAEARRSPKHAVVALQVIVEDRKQRIVEESKPRTSPLWKVLPWAVHIIVAAFVM